MLTHLLAFVLGFLLCKYQKPIRGKAFAAFMASTASKISPEFEAFKAKTYKGLKEIRSKFPEMQEKNSIKVLEIGVGSGANFQYYPEGCHLTVVDPNPDFRSYYNKNRAKYPHIESEEIIVCGGEAMHMVPDNSVDVVLVSWVLCSASDPQGVLEQILRVLVPGGRFYFVEHIREFDMQKNSYRAYKQDFVSNTGIWQATFFGCTTNRETLNTIKKAGFSDLHYERVYAPGLHGFIFGTIEPHIAGYATK